MAAASFFGHLLLGLGPGAAFFALVLARKSFVALLALFSAFLWLSVLLLTAAVFRGFVPLAPQQPAYAGALLAAVAIEEVARYGVWRLHAATLRALRGMAARSGHAFTALDELYLALGWGYGHAAVHVLFLFGGLLPLTAGHGTLYTAACPALSVFTVGALNALGMGATLVALSVVALDAWGRAAASAASSAAASSAAAAAGGAVVGSSGVGVGFFGQKEALLLGRAYAPLVHAGAALLTLGSMRPNNGCVTAVAAQLALGLANTYYAASIAWRRSTNGTITASGGGGGGSSSRRVSAADDGAGRARGGSGGGGGGAATVPASPPPPAPALPPPAAAWSAPPAHATLRSRAGN